MQTSIYGRESNNLILVGIGANLPSAHGSPLESCIAALKALEERDVRAIRRSRWYKSAPVPLSSQPWFVNGVVAVESPLDPVGLLNLLHDVEALFGRERKRANEARTLDLDLLDFRGELCSGPALELPHPRLAARAFVLLPLAEIAPGWRHPRSGVEIAELVGSLDPDETATPIE